MTLDEVLSYAYGIEHSLHQPARGISLNSLMRDVKPAEAAARLLALKSVDDKRCYVTAWQRRFLTQVLDRARA